MTNIFIDKLNTDSDFRSDEIHARVSDAAFQFRMLTYTVCIDLNSGILCKFKNETYHFFVAFHNLILGSGGNNVIMRLI